MSAKILVYDLNVGQFSVLQPRTTINGLFFTSRPTAVLWRVVAIGINSVKRSAGISLPMHFVGLFHVAIKVFKLIPRLAVFYTSRAVIFCVRVVRVINSLAHVYPSQVYRVPTAVVLNTNKSHTVLFLPFRLSVHRVRISYSQDKRNTYGY